MKLLLTGLAISLAVAVPTAAADDDDATPHRYAGGCGFTTVNDTTPNHALGGNETWNGQADVLVRTTDATGTPTVEPVAVACELFVGGVSHGVVLSASGHGVAVGAAKLQFRAGAADTVTICTHVTVGTRHTHCDEASTTRLVPESVTELFNTVIDAVNALVLTREPSLCERLQSLAGSYGPVYVNEEGDIFLFGTTTPDHLWWDCAPYYVPPGG